MSGFLVVGGDSLVGGEVVRALRRRGHHVIATTRRAETVGDDRVYLDFANAGSFNVPANVDYAFVIAAATNYDRCENDPLAEKINVELIPQLVGSLLERGLFVTFISTNSVFGGEVPWPGEDDPHAPGIAYSRQKSEGEAAIHAAGRARHALDRINITRLTKILAPATPPLPAWTAAWQRGETVQPFDDLIFAPLSLQFAGDSLARIGELRFAGNLHLSGAENVSYADFARALAARLGVDSSLIAPTTATAQGVQILFKPTFSGIGMRKTKKVTGIEPQTLASVIDDLLMQKD
ncbi:MAG: sugar nucleotide-binding protein [Thermoanaerobaculia bacterium]